jgi:DNA primase
MAIPQSFIQELIARADVVDIVGRHVQLKKGGANHMGLCPFHAEKSPSFSVSPTKQFYHCFGCGKNGNVIGFLMDYLGLGFVEAVKDLAQQYGMLVPEDDSDPREREQAALQRERRSTLSEVLEKAGEAYRQHLRTSPQAIAYLKGRGLSGEIAQRFGLGYAPEGWRTLASVFPRYDDPLLVETGLVISSTEEDEGEEKRYDRFRDRIMFPIRNVKGEHIGFGGRVMGDGTPKYLNSPETPVFSKGRELYGLFEARTAIRESGFVLVTEGYMDVVALAQLGFPNAVATLGTACTPEHVRLMFRFTDAVVFSFDGDAAGRRAAHKALDGALTFATDVRNVKFLFLPAEHDPDSYIREFGSEAFAGMVAQAQPLSQFLLEAASQDCDLQTAEGRARMASQARPLWSQLPAGALKAQLIGDIADKVQLGVRELGNLWGQAARAAAPQRAERATQDGAATDGVADGASWQASGAFGRQAALPPGRLKGRPAPLGRPERAARLLLTYPGAWEHLSSEDHILLCQLPAPHGPLFVWFESQLHDHGALPWGALREGLRGHESEELALRAMSGGDGAPTRSEAQDETETATALTDSRAELRDLLNRMLVEKIKAQETDAIRRAASDPNALSEYRELHQRRRELEGMLQAGPALPA